MDKKKVVLTGASSGIGEATAIELAKSGADILLCARRADRLESVAKVCKQVATRKEQKFIVCVTDVAKDESCKNMIATASSALGGIDVLILNAGIGSANQRFGELKSLDAFEEVFDINYWGCLRPTLYSLPLLRQAHGAIWVVTSLTAYAGVPYRTGYGYVK